MMSRKIPIKSSPSRLLCRYPERRILHWGSECKREMITRRKTNQMSRHTQEPYTWEPGGACWFDKGGVVNLHLWGFDFVFTGDTMLLKAPASSFCQMMAGLAKLIPDLADYPKQYNLAHAPEDSPVFKHALYKWARSADRGYGNKHPLHYKTLCGKLLSLQDEKVRNQFHEYNLWVHNIYPHRFKKISVPHTMYKRINLLGKGGFKKRKSQLRKEQNESA